MRFIYYAYTARNNTSLSPSHEPIFFAIQTAGHNSGRPLVRILILFLLLALKNHSLKSVLLLDSGNLEVIPVLGLAIWNKCAAGPVNRGLTHYELQSQKENSSPHL